MQLGSRCTGLAGLRAVSRPSRLPWHPADRVIVLVSFEDRTGALPSPLPRTTARVILRSAERRPEVRLWATRDITGQVTINELGIDRDSVGSRARSSPLARALVVHDHVALPPALSDRAPSSVFRFTRCCACPLRRFEGLAGAHLIASGRLDLDHSHRDRRGAWNRTAVAKKEAKFSTRIPDACRSGLAGGLTACAGGAAPRRAETPALC